MPLHPVPNLRINAYFSRGDWDGYCNIIFDAPIEKDNVFYRIEYHRVGDPPTTWTFQEDVPWGTFLLGRPIKYAHANAGGGARIQIVDQAKVTTTSTDDSQTPVAATLAIPSSLVSDATTHFAATNFNIATAGELGALTGNANLAWQDLTKYMVSGRITLTKYGVTSPYVQQTLVDRTFSGTVGTAPNFVQLLFNLLPPGIQLFLDDNGDLIWDPANPPPGAPDNAALCVVEGDRLTFTLVTDNGSGPITTVRNFYYHRTARFYQFNDVATVGQLYNKQVQVIQDRWVPIPITATFSGVMPSGLNINSSGLISGVPTTVGDYSLLIHITGQGNTTNGEQSEIVVNLVGIPVIKSPGHTVTWTARLPYSHAYDLYATNNPTSYAAVGTMPVGLTFDTATGNINGTPTTEQSATVNFTATNAAGTSSPPYAITFNIVIYDPPTIISANLINMFQDTLANYTIKTDLIANDWRAFDLPNGLERHGRTIIGTPDVDPGSYVVGLQAANRWGWGPVFQLTIVIDIAPPVISSPLAVTTELGAPFSYQIVASHAPDAFDAVGLPPGLTINKLTGEITGVPTTVGDTSITIKAVNQGDSDTQILVLTVILPAVPVIDTTATHGRAITAETGIPIHAFNAVASHNPTSWVVAPIPDGLTLSIIPDPTGAGTSAQLTGTFQQGGLFSVSFTAKNLGGSSATAVFYFLVTIGPTEAQVINVLGTVMEIWIDLNAATVGIGPTPTIGDTGTFVIPTGTGLNIKRGDTQEIFVVFHEDGTPADVVLATLKFGIKPSYDDEFIVYTDTWAGTGGRFQIYPDFSGTNDDLDAVLVAATTTLMAEIQWEMLDDHGNTIRRSSVVFPVNVMRDLIHPD